TMSRASAVLKTRPAPVGTSSSNSAATRSRKRTSGGTVAGPGAAPVIGRPWSASMGGGARHGLLRHLLAFDEVPDVGSDLGGARDRDPMGFAGIEAEGHVRHQL